MKTTNDIKERIKQIRKENQRIKNKIKGKESKRNISNEIKDSLYTLFILFILFIIGISFIAACILSYCWFVCRNYSIGKLYSLFSRIQWGFIALRNLLKSKANNQSNTGSNNQSDNQSNFPHPPHSESIPQESNNNNYQIPQYKQPRYDLKHARYKHTHEDPEQIKIWKQEYQGTFDSFEILDKPLTKKEVESLYFPRQTIGLKDQYNNLDLMGWVSCS